MGGVKYLGPPPGFQGLILAQLGTRQVAHSSHSVCLPLATLDFLPVTEHIAQWAGVSVKTLSVKCHSFRAFPLCP